MVSQNCSREERRFRSPFQQWVGKTNSQKSSLCVQHLCALLPFVCVQNVYLKRNPGCTCQGTVSPWPCGSCKESQSAALAASIVTALPNLKQLRLMPSSHWRPGLDPLSLSFDVSFYQTLLQSSKLAQQLQQLHALGTCFGAEHIYAQRVLELASQMHGLQVRMSDGEGSRKDRILLSHVIHPDQSLEYFDAENGQ